MTKSVNSTAASCPINPIAVLNISKLSFASNKLTPLNLRTSSNLAQEAGVGKTFPGLIFSKLTYKCADLVLRNSMIKLSTFLDLAHDIQSD